MENANGVVITKLKYLMAISGLFALMAGSQSSPLSTTLITEIVDLKLNVQKPQAIKGVQIRATTEILSAYDHNRNNPLYHCLNIHGGLPALETKYVYLDNERNIALTHVSNYLMVLKTHVDLQVNRLFDMSRPNVLITFAKLLTQPRPKVLLLVYQLVVLILGQSKSAMIASCGVMHHQGFFVVKTAPTSLSEIARLTLKSVAYDSEENFKELISTLCREIMFDKSVDAESFNMFTDFIMLVANSNDPPEGEFVYRFLWVLLFGCPPDIELVVADDNVMTKNQNRYAMQYSYMQIQQFLIFDKSIDDVEVLKHELIYQLMAKSTKSQKKRRTSNIHHISPFTTEWVISNPRLLGLYTVQKLVTGNNQIYLLGPSIRTLNWYVTHLCADWPELKTHLGQYSEFVRMNLQVAIDVGFSVGATMPINIYLLEHYVTMSYVNRVVPLAYGNGVDLSTPLMSSIYPSQSIPRIHKFLEVQQQVPDANQPSQTKPIPYRKNMKQIVDGLEAMSANQSVVLHAPCPGELANGRWYCALTPIMSYGWGNCRMLSGFAVLYRHLHKSSRFVTPYDVIVPSLAATMSESNIELYLLRTPFQRANNDQFLTAMTNLMLSVSTVLLYRVLVMNHKCFAQGQATPEQCQLATERFLGNMSQNYEYIRRELMLELNKLASKSAPYWLEDVWAVPDGMERYALCLNMYRLINVLLWTAYTERPDESLYFLTNPTISDQQQAELFWMSVQATTIANRSLYDLAQVFNIIHISLESPFLHLLKMEQFKTSAKKLNGNHKFIDKLTNEPDLAKLETKLVKMLGNPAQVNAVPFYYALLPTLIGGQRPTKDAADNNNYSHMPLIVHDLKYDNLVTANPNHEIVYSLRTPGHAAIVLTHPGVNSNILYHKVIRPYSGLVRYWLNLVLTENAQGLLDLQSALVKIDEEKIGQYVTSGLGLNDDLYGHAYFITTRDLTNRLVAMTENPTHINLNIVRSSIAKNQTTISQNITTLKLADAMTQLTEYFSFQFNSETKETLYFDGQSFYDLAVVVGRLCKPMETTKIHQLLRLTDSESNLLSLLNIGSIMIWASAINESNTNMSNNTLNLMAMLYNSVSTKFIPNSPTMIDVQARLSANMPVKTFVNVLSSLGTMASYDEFIAAYLNQVIRLIVDTKDSSLFCGRFVNSEDFGLILAITSYTARILDQPEVVKQLVLPSYDYVAGVRRMIASVERLQKLHDFVKVNCRIMGYVASILTSTVSSDAAVSYLTNLVTTTELLTIRPLIQNIFIYIIRDNVFSSSEFTIDFIHQNLHDLNVLTRTHLLDLYRLRSTDHNRYVALLRTLFTNLQAVNIYEIRSTVVRGLVNIACAWSILATPYYAHIMTFWKVYFYYYLTVEYALQDFFDIAMPDNLLEQELVDLPIDMARLKHALDDGRDILDVVFACATAIPPELFARILLPVYPQPVNLQPADTNLNIVSF